MKVFVWTNWELCPMRILCAAKEKFFETIKL